MTEDQDKYEKLKLKSQLCFPLYACSKEIVRRYKPFLDPLELTYTQYLVMMVMWEEENLTFKVLGEKLWLDSGTLTPVIKKLDSKGFIRRERSLADERTVNLSITDEGRRLKEKAKTIPKFMGDLIKLEPEEFKQLHKLLYKILNGFK